MALIIDHMPETTKEEVAEKADFKSRAKALKLSSSTSKQYVLDQESKKKLGKIKVKDITDAPKKTDLQIRAVAIGMDENATEEQIVTFELGQKPNAFPNTGIYRPDAKPYDLDQRAIAVGIDYNSSLEQIELAESNAGVTPPLSPEKEAASKNKVAK